MGWNAKEKIVIKQASTAALTIFTMLFVAVVWDKFNINSIVFPWIANWEIRTKFEVGCCSILLLFALFAGAVWNLNIRLRDVTYER